MNILLSDTKTVYEHLQDDYSRWLYEKRVMWSLTGDSTYVNEITSSIVDANGIEELMKKAEQVSDRLVIRGVGNDYWIIKRLYPGLDFKLFVDNDPTKQHRIIDGKQVITPDEFYEHYRDHYVFINSTSANAEIKEELKQHGIPEEHMINLGKCYEDICDKQYFDKEIMKKSCDEIFIDGGCYDGRNIYQFVRWCDGDYKKIYSFEPDPGNYKLVEKRIKAKPLSGVKLLNKGLWNESTEIKFVDDGTQGARISDNGQTVIQTTTIDETVGDDRVTFSKLDVEGAEYNALLGAEHAITTYRPKLAISVYHKPEDIFEIPELILSMHNDYKFYLRHYQLSPNETILYAV